MDAVLHLSMPCFAAAYDSRLVSSESEIESFLIRSGVECSSGTIDLLKGFALFSCVVLSCSK